ncbi:MAG: BlaI/MecI/CopY family transcriptional regulator [Proteiniphilum sp.]|nr:BlaI/MecI/CopY family transcriptional regulator [Proteiniphilum sp.]
MKKLTEREEEIMQLLWEKGPMFVKDILETFPNPKPHYNTVSTVIRILEEKGFVAHKAYGTTHQYYASIKQEEYKGSALKKVISKYFDNSYTKVVSTLIKQEELSISELKHLIEEIEKGSEK